MRASLGVSCMQSHPCALQCHDQPPSIIRSISCRDGQMCPVQCILLYIMMGWALSLVCILPRFLPQCQARAPAAYSGLTVYIRSNHLMWLCISPVAVATSHNDGSMIGMAARHSNLHIRQELSYTLTYCMQHTQFCHNSWHIGQLT